MRIITRDSLEIHNISFEARAQGLKEGVRVHNVYGFKYVVVRFALNAYNFDVGTCQDYLKTICKRKLCKMRNYYFSTVLL